MHSSESDLQVHESAVELVEIIKHLENERNKYKTLANQHYHRYQEALKEIAELKLKLQNKET